MAAIARPTVKPTRLGELEAEGDSPGRPSLELGVVAGEARPLAGAGGAPADSVLRGGKKKLGRA
jgi:hypothetical protein